MVGDVSGAQPNTKLGANADRKAHRGPALIPDPYPRDAVCEQEPNVHPKQATASTLHASWMTRNADGDQQERG